MPRGSWRGQGWGGWNSLTAGQDSLIFSLLPKDEACRWLPHHSEITATSKQDSESRKTTSLSPSMSWSHLCSKRRVQKGPETQEVTAVAMVHHSQADLALHIATADPFFTS